MKLKFVLICITTMHFGCSTISNKKNISVDSITAKKIAITDKNGVERVVIMSNSVDVPILGKVYKRREPATGIIIYNTQGDETGGLAMLDDGTISLTLDGYKGKEFSERVSMYVFPDGRSGILVKDLQNNTRIRLGVDKEKNSTFEVLDAKENAKIRGSVSAKGRVKFKK